MPNGRVDPDSESLDPHPQGGRHLDLLRGGDAGELARRHGCSQPQLFLWRHPFLQAGHAALRTRQGRAEQERDRQVRELERKVGQLTVENEILKKPTR